MVHVVSAALPCLFTNISAACRTHADPQIAAQLASLHAALLAASPTRSTATTHIIQHIVLTVQHLSVEVPLGSEASGGGAAGGHDPDQHPTATAEGSASVDAGSSSDGLHDQLASISSGIAAVDQAVAEHQDAAVCLVVWQELVHLAAPTGRSQDTL